MLLIRNVIFFCFLLFWSAVNGQDKDISVSLSVKNMHIKEILKLVEQQSSYRFAYSSDLLSRHKPVTISVQNMPVKELMAILFKDNPVSYTFIGTQVILEKAPALKSITISGYIRDNSSGEALPGAHVFIPTLKKGVASNAYSFYSLTLKELDYLNLIVSHEGYEKMAVRINARKNGMQNFNLIKKEIQFRADSIDIPDLLKPISFHSNIISLNSADSLIQPVAFFSDTVSTSKDTSEKSDVDKTWAFYDVLNTTSSLSGNGDVVNSIQMMPGVMAGLDASTGYFVRGGNADQNKIQVDEATLYNPSHFFGLVSIINPSAVNSGTLVKDGFPVSYGDNLSSVLDISMKEGNNQKTNGDLQIGTTISGFSFNGPIQKGKSSYLVSARRSVMDLWLRPIQSGNDYNNYYFYDINAKINFQLSDNNHLYLSLYQGRDNSSYSLDSTNNNPIKYGVDFGNQALTLRWNHLYSQKVFSNVSFVYNNYSQSVTASQKPYYAELYSGIRDVESKIDLNYYPNTNHKISGGLSFLFQTIMPASVSDQELSTHSIISVNPSNIPQKQSGRFATYLGDEMNIGDNLKIYAGVRMPVFFGSDIQYTQLEPRFSLLYLTSVTTGFKFTYTQMHQYLHLVKSYNASFPAEIWLGSSENVKPESSKQTTVGMFKKMGEDKYQANVELYYKEMGNQLLFKGGIQPTITSDMENTLIFGEEKSYGAEFSLQKVKGDLKGWLAYTLSYADQHFDSLNLGESFPFANDRRHCLYVTASYSFNEHWEISSNLILASGRSFTLNSLSSAFPGQGKGLYDNASRPNQGKSKARIEQNNYKLAPYNRMDISVSYKKERQLTHRLFETEWVFSVYNVYARPNTSLAYRSIDPVTQLPVVQQVSFFPIIPSLSYKLRF
jgi:hypothetical protein